MLNDKEHCGPHRQMQNRPIPLYGVIGLFILGSFAQRMCAVLPITSIHRC